MIVPMIEANGDVTELHCERLYSTYRKSYLTPILINHETTPTEVNINIEDFVLERHAFNLNCDKYAELNIYVSINFRKHSKSRIDSIRYYIHNCAPYLFTYASRKTI